MEAFFEVAIFLLQLYQGLRIGSTVYLQACFTPHTYDIIVFRFQFLKEIGSPFTQPFVTFETSVGVQECYDCIDDDQVERGITQGLSPAG